MPHCKDQRHPLSLKQKISDSFDPCEKMYNTLCCPVLKPQITGDPEFPGLVILKVSLRQSPILPPILLVAPVATAVVVPTAGPAI